MNLKTLSQILSTIWVTLSILLAESEPPRWCKSMQRQGIMGISWSFRSVSLAEWRLMLIMIEMILFYVVISKKSIIFNTKDIAPLVRIAWGFSSEIFSRALIQASFKSIKPIDLSKTNAKLLTPPWVTMLLQMLGNISIRFVKHWMANTK